MSAERGAAEILARHCCDAYAGFGVVVADSELLRRIPKRRQVTRGKELLRLREVGRQVAAHLSGGGTMPTAMEIVRLAGFANLIVVTEGYDQLAKAVADRLRAGDNGWDPWLVCNNMIAIAFWYDD